MGNRIAESFQFTVGNLEFITFLAQFGSHFVQVINHQQHFLLALPQHFHLGFQLHGPLPDLPFEVLVQLHDVFAALLQLLIPDPEFPGDCLLPDLVNPADGRKDGQQAQDDHDQNQD